MPDSLIFLNGVTRKLQSPAVTVTIATAPSSDCGAQFYSGIPGNRGIRDFVRRCPATVAVSNSVQKGKLQGVWNRVQSLGGVHLCKHGSWGLLIAA